MTETKSGRVFRNKSPVRSFVLPPRFGQTQPFTLGPSQTMQAQDEVDERILGMYHDIVDVAKESPSIGDAHERLRQEVQAERDINAKLREENKTLQAELKAARGQEEPAAEAPVEASGRKGKKK